MIVIYLGPILAAVVASIIGLFCFVRCISIIWKSQLRWFARLGLSLLLLSPGVVIVGTLLLITYNSSYVFHLIYLVSYVPIYLLITFGLNPVIPIYLYSKNETRIGKISLIAFGAAVLFAYFTYLIWHNAPVY